METRAIILVAGMSTRIREISEGMPKSFLKVGDETLIERSTRLVRGAGISDITLVTGFMADVFRERMNNCQFVHNSDFKSTNTSVSLSLALNARTPSTDTRILVLNGDVYFAEGIIEGMLAADAPAVAAVQRHALSEEEVKVFVSGDAITRIGKHLNEDLAYGEAFGMYLFGPRFATYLRQELRLLGNPKIFYEEAVDRLLQAGHTMTLNDVGDALVREVDYPDDYRELKKLIGG